MTARIQGIVDHIDVLSVPQHRSPLLDAVPAIRQN
jgi:hypothetical protein